MQSYGFAVTLLPVLLAELIPVICAYGVQRYKQILVKFEVLTVVVLNVAIFWWKESGS
jgi:hypothetical protein